mmetsp:Transcript_786/g.1724  ORF Transcript_786/g.1724 Transcript_786/m.1724 type:complete len:259 (-) Transcript_786:149-925(-)
MAMKPSSSASLEEKDSNEKSRPFRGETTLILLDACTTPTTSPLMMMGAHAMQRVLAPSFVSRAGMNRGSCVTSGTFAQIFLDTTSPSIPVCAGIRNPSAFLSLDRFTTSSVPVGSSTNIYMRSAFRMVYAASSSRSIIFVLTSFEKRLEQIDNNSRDAFSWCAMVEVSFNSSLELFSVRVFKSERKSSIPMTSRRDTSTCVSLESSLGKFRGIPCAFLPLEAEDWPLSNIIYRLSLRSGCSLKILAAPASHELIGSPI